MQRNDVRSKTTETPQTRTSRRRSPRIEVMGQFHGQLVPMSVPLLVRNLGSGGFGVESAIDFPLDAVHRFRFTTPDGLEVIVSATARHCRPLNSSSGAPRFAAGFEFVEDGSSASDDTVERLLEAATSVITFQ